jgi:hypothetical protein
MRLRTLAALGALGVLACVGRARADGQAPSANTVAQALFEQAREDMKRGAYPAACPKLEESQRLDPSNGTLLNLVLCEEATGKVASAWSNAHELADRLPADDERKPITERKLLELTKRVPKLAVRLELPVPEGTTVLLDDVELRPSSLGVPIPIDPGIHTLVVTAPNRPNRRAKVAIEEAQEIDWLAQVAPAEVEVPRVDLSPPTKVADATRRPTWVPWATLSIGATSLVASAVLAVMTLDRRSTVLRECPAKMCSDSGIQAADDGKRLEVGAIVTLGVGVAAGGLGAYLLTRSGPTPGASPPAHPAAAQGAVVTYSLLF